MADLGRGGLEVRRWYLVVVFGVAASAHGEYLGRVLAFRPDTAFEHLRPDAGMTVDRAKANVRDAFTPW